MTRNAKVTICDKSAVIIAIIALIISAWTSWNANEISDRAYQLEKDAYKVISPFQKPIIYIVKSMRI